MERADIKLAIDMLDGLRSNEPCEDNHQLDHCTNVFMDCGNEIATLRAQLAKLTAERDALKEDADKWREHEQRKADLISRGFLKSPLRDCAAIDQARKGE